MCQNALVPDFKSSDRFIEQFKPDQTFFKVFKSYHKQAQERDLNYNLLKLCKAYIGRVAFDNNCYYTLLLKEDPMIKKIQLLQKKL